MSEQSPLRPLDATAPGSFPDRNLCVIARHSIVTPLVAPLLTDLRAPPSEVRSSTGLALAET